MHHRLTVVAPLIVVALALAGCATAFPLAPAAEPTPAAPTPTPTPTADPLAKACTQLGAAMTIEFNASADYRDGLATKEEYAGKLAQAKAALTEVSQLPDSDITPMLTKLVSELEPTNDGLPFAVDERYYDGFAPIGAACTASGTDVIIKAERGG